MIASDNDSKQTANNAGEILQQSLNRQKAYRPALRLFAFVLVVALVLAAAIGLLALLTGGKLITLLFVAAAIIPIAFFVQVWKQNRGTIRGWAWPKAIPVAILSIIYTLPLVLVIAPVLGLSYAIDSGLSLGIEKCNNALKDTEKVKRTVIDWVTYEWYDPRSWLYGSKVKNAIDSTVNVPKHTGAARSALLWLRHGLVIFQLWSYAIFVYIILRSFGYIVVRIMCGRGVHFTLALD